MCKSLCLALEYFPQGTGRVRVLSLKVWISSVSDMRNESVTVHSRTRCAGPEERKTPPQITNCLQQVARDVLKIGSAVINQAVASLTEPWALRTCESTREVS